MKRNIPPKDTLFRAQGKFALIIGERLGKHAQQQNLRAS
jgi:hypothetical protein